MSDGKGNITSPTMMQIATIHACSLKDLSVISKSSGESGIGYISPKKTKYMTPMVIKNNGSKSNRIFFLKNGLLV